MPGCGGAVVAARLGDLDLGAVPSVVRLLVQWVVVARDQDGSSGHPQPPGEGPPRCDGAFRNRAAAGLPVDSG